MSQAQIRRALLQKMIIVMAGILTACSSSMQSQVTINAPPERVWEVLSDVESYPEWNPFFVEAKGELVVGNSLDVTMQPVGKDKQSFSPKVLEVDHGRKLVWRGRLLIPWLFDGTHHFTIERVGTGSVKFTQYEDFSGVFVPFVGFEPYHQGWELMNAALKKRVERASAPKRVDSEGPKLSQSATAP